jgi:hypothetical protein
VDSLRKISFCLTPEEVEAVETARRRLGAAGILLNRSETIRAAIASLGDLNTAALKGVAVKTQHLKPGRK